MFNASLPSDGFLGNKSNSMANTQGLTPDQADAVNELDLGMYDADLNRIP